MLFISVDVECTCIAFSSSVLLSSSIILHPSSIVFILNCIFSLAPSKVVLATLSGCGSGVFEDAVSQARIKFKVVLIDEAAQAVEPSCLIPLRFGAVRLRACLCTVWE
jgi:hypothetical protein